MQVNNSIVYFGFVILVILLVEIECNQVYNMIHERAELISYNESLCEPDVVFSFKKVSKTAFAFNASYTTTHDFMDKKIMLKIMADKLFGGEYKRTGTSFTVNVCKFMEKNTFGLKDLVNKYGNIKYCEVPKGFYYVRNLLPDEKMFPKFIPFGSYRVIIHVFHEDVSVSLFVMHWYARIEKIIKY